MLKKFIVTAFLEPIYFFVNLRYDYLNYYHTLKRNQWHSLAENSRIQADLLFNILKYASEEIPYYREIVRANSIQFSKNTILRDIKKFPMLTKDIIRKEFKNLYCLRKGIKWYNNTSGGSTGEPVKLIQDNIYKSKMLIVKKWQKEWAQFQVGDSIIRLWGSEKDILKEKESLQKRFLDWMRSSYILNSFSMDEDQMHKYVGYINKKKPKMILAYVSSIVELAKFIEKNNLDVYSPKAVMTSAGVLYPSFRELIERVFRCKVFNRYGSREVGDIACECEKHEGLHVSMFTHYVEILNKNLKPCKEGETGDIYVTLLTNYTMPLIRYKIGDMATYTNKKCSCGRGLSLIKDIVGRTGCMVRTKDQVIDSTALTTSFYVCESIVRYQFIQKSLALIHIKVVVDNRNLWEKERRKLDEKLRKILGKNINIKYEVVDKIKPTPSGKYQYFVSEL